MKSKIFLMILIPLCLLILAAILIYLNRDHWWWCVVGAVLTAPAELKEE